MWSVSFSGTRAVLIHFTHLSSSIHLLDVCLSIVALTSLKSSSAERQAVCAEAWSVCSPQSLLPGTSPAPSLCPPPPLPPAQRSCLPLEWAVFLSVLLGLPQLGWAELAQEMIFWIPLEIGCSVGKGKTLLSQESHHWIYTCSLKWCNEWVDEVNSVVQLSFVTQVRAMQSSGKSLTP